MTKYRFSSGHWVHLQAQESMNDMKHPLGHRKMGRISTTKSIEGLLLDLHGFTYMDLHGFTWIYQVRVIYSDSSVTRIPTSNGVTQTRPQTTPGPGSRGQPSMICDAMRPEEKTALHWQSLTLRSFAAIQNDTIPVLGKCLVKRIKHILWFYTEKEWKRSQGFLLPQFWIGLGMWFTESVEDRATMVMLLCPSIQPFDTMRNHRFSTFFVVFFPYRCHLIKFPTNPKGPTCRFMKQPKAPASYE